MASQGIKQWSRKPFSVQERFNDILAWGIKKKTPIAVAFIIAILLSAIFIYFKQLFLMGFFIAVGASSLIYQRFIRISLGVELITIGVVIMGRLYGPGTAIFVGFFALLFAELLSGALQHKTIVSFIGIVTIGFLTQFFHGTTITNEGIALVIIYNCLIIPGYLLLGSNPFRSIIFVATHIAFNIWIFSTIAPVTLRILS